MSRPRLLGASVEPLHDFHEQGTRTSGLFVELERLFPLAGFIRPVLTGPADWAVKLLSFHPRRDAWRGRAGLSPLAFRLRSDMAGRQLARREGLFDLVFQLQTLFAPGPEPADPYVIYTDNTYSQTRRHYPGWAPLGRRADREWLELEAQTFRGASRVFGWSNWVCDAIVDDYGCDPGRVLAVGAGGRSALTPPEEKSYARRIAIFVGNKYELKGVPTLLDAWARVREALPDALLWIVGVDRPRSARTDLHSVEWFGYVDPQRLAQLYGDATVFVLPTQFEAYGQAVVEAMGHALPCVTTDVGALPELVEDGVTGVLVAPREPEQLANALIGLLSDPERAERLGRSGYAKAVESLTWRAVAERMAPHLEAAPGG